VLHLVKKALQITNPRKLAADKDCYPLIAKMRADFVLLNKSYLPVVVIELDDSSHRGRESKDARRDSYVKEAGIAVLRYPGHPTLEQLKSDLLQFT
jgi:very-short-patch-repair endonuclease